MIAAGAMLLVWVSRAVRARRSIPADAVSRSHAGAASWRLRVVALVAPLTAADTWVLQAPMFMDSVVKARMLQGSTLSIMRRPGSIIPKPGPIIPRSAAR